MEKEYADNATVQLLQTMGFSDDYIMKGIDNGDIKIEKSKSTEDMDRSEDRQERNVKNDKKHIKDLEKDEEEDKDDEKDLKRDKKAKEEKEKRDDLEKSITNDIMKSMGETLSQSLLTVLTPVIKGLNARMDASDEILKSMSKQAPDFRSGSLSNLTTIEKSMGNFEKGEDGKVSLNIISQRPLVRSLIEKAMDTDPDFTKSFGSDALNYLSYPEADTVGQGMAQYLYDKMGVKLGR